MAKGKAVKQPKGKAATEPSTEAQKKKEPKAKKKGKEWSWGQDDLEAELAVLGLRVKQVTGDGNCFFRSLCDQLEGCEKSHGKLRQQVVDYIRENEEMFQPFVEDDEPFPRYVSRMAKDGTWAGYIELIAASNCLEANIHVYQPGQPRWVVGSFPNGRTLHVSYHDGQHYNSVRNAGDHSSGAPPEPIVLQQVSAAAAAAAAGKGAGAGSGGPGGDWGEREERMVCRNSGCHDRALVRKALEEAKGDVDAAVEKVIEALSHQAEQEEEEEGQGGEQAQAQDPGREGAAGDGEAEAGAGARAASEGEVQGDHEGQGHDRAAGSAAAASATTPSSSGTTLAAGVAVGEQQLVVTDAVGESCARALADPGVGADVEAVERHSGTCDSASEAPAAATAAGVPVAVQGAEPGTAVKVQEAACEGGGDGADGLGDGGVSGSDAGDGEHGAPRVEDGADAVPSGDGKAAGKKSAKVKTRKCVTVKAEKKPSRNKDCPCGSRQKYKNCCGTAAAAASRRQAAASGDAAAAAVDTGTGSPAVSASAAAVAAAAKHLAAWHM